MNQALIFWPMIIMAFVTMMLYVVLYRKRVSLLKDAKTDAKSFRLGVDEHEESLQINNAIANQFQLPVLFYAAGLGLYATGGVGYAALLFGWGFVLAKMVHIYIHITTNRLMVRQRVFSVAFVFCVLMWWTLALQLANII